MLTKLKYDFSGMGPWLFGGLIALCTSPCLVSVQLCLLLCQGMTGIVGIFIPFSRGMDLVFAIGGCLLFSGYIVYDTYIINSRLSPDEFIMGAISLYLECVICIAIILPLVDHTIVCDSVSSIFVRFLLAISLMLGTDILFPVLSILRLLNNIQER
jgi:FtsH-binding integral membrane protein